MSSLFRLIASAAAMLPAVKQTSEKAGQEARHESELFRTQTEVRYMRDALQRVLLINEALWEILREKFDLKDEDLKEKMYQIDMRDGTLDNQNRRPFATCPGCGRAVSPRHATCIYCGQIVDDSVFHIS